MEQKLLVSRHREFWGMSKVLKAVQKNEKKQIKLKNSCLFYHKEKDNNMD